MPHSQLARTHSSKLSTGAASLSRTTSAQNIPRTVPTIDKTGVSLEQSVKKFRIVEALRSGDTASISKAIRETAENAPRLSTSSLSGGPGGALEDTTILHLAIQCAQFPVIEYVLSDGMGNLDVNSRDKDGNTGLHIAANQGRTAVVKLLLEQTGINDAVANNQSKLPLDLARNPEIFQLLQLSRSLFTESKVQQVQELIINNDYDTLAQVLEEPRLKMVLDINSPEFASEPLTVQSGGTLLHEAARRKNAQLIQVLLLHGADPFRRDRKGKLPQSIATDDSIKALIKKSPAAVAAQRGIQEKAVLGHAAAQGATSAGISDPLAGREAREMKGYLKKWTNYRKGYQLRWFVLEDGVLSYYKHQDDAGSACRGAINMRIAKLHMSPDEKTKFEIHGKSSVKYTLKANHEVEAKRWFWSLNNSIQWSKDQAREEDRQTVRNAELLRNAKEHGASLSMQESHSEEASLSDLQRSTSQLPSRSVTSGKAPMQRPEFVSPSTVGSMDDYEFGDAATDTDFLGAQAGLVIPGERDDDDDDYGDDMSVRDESTATKDALNITAQSAKLQLETMSTVHSALLTEVTQNPSLCLTDPNVTQALSTYDAAIRSLTGLVGDLLRISKDRDAYWQYRLDRESSMRRMWEESMAQVAHEQEILEARVGEAEMKRKQTKRALREVIESGVAGGTPTAEAPADEQDRFTAVRSPPMGIGRRGTVMSQMVDIGISESDEEDDEEFFDAVEAGEIKVAKALPADAAAGEKVVVSGPDISSSFRGYENGIRHRLKMDADDRPKISLWVC